MKLKLKQADRLKYLVEREWYVVWTLKKYT